MTSRRPEVSSNDGADHAPTITITMTLPAVVALRVFELAAVGLQCRAYFDEPLGSDPDLLRLYGERVGVSPDVIEQVLRVEH